MKITIAHSKNTTCHIILGKYPIKGKYHYDVISTGDSIMEAIDNVNKNAPYIWRYVPDMLSYIQFNIPTSLFSFYLFNYIKHAVKKKVVELMPEEFL